jgi:hypothetical protein
MVPLSRTFMGDIAVCRLDLGENIQTTQNLFRYLINAGFRRSPLARETIPIPIQREANKMAAAAQYGNFLPVLGCRSRPEPRPG